jgi:hypothetical protein
LKWRTASVGVWKLPTKARFLFIHPYADFVGEIHLLGVAHAGDESDAIVAGDFGHEHVSAEQIGIDRGVQTPDRKVIAGMRRFDEDARFAVEAKKE